MSDICESCGCPEGVDGHDVLTRKIDELETALRNSKAVDNVATAIGSMDAEERSHLCKYIVQLEEVARHAARFARGDEDGGPLSDLLDKLENPELRFTR